MVDLATFIEIKLKQQDDFLKVRETLTRIGVASKKTKTLYQSCHILHKQGKYYLVHFKQLFALDGRETNYDENDRARTNTIANLLEEWGLIELAEPTKSEAPVVAINQLKILSYKEKPEWTCVAKYTIGNAKRKVTDDEARGNK